MHFRLVSAILAIAVSTSLHAAPGTSATTLLVEAESFADRGGWVIDQQAMDQMGSPFLLAHGLGRPVADAITTIAVKAPGNFQVWVRTRDWVAPWKAPGAPGKFQLKVNGRPLEALFGTQGEDWHWQRGGAVELPAGKTTLALHDLTGFDGRCDALLFSRDQAFVPPNDGAALAEFRRQALGLPREPEEAGDYDLVVVGGGMAGCCAAISAARLGCRVALVQDRPILGGNNSSEVRVGLSGLIHQQPYPRLGDLVDEIGPIGHWTLWEAKRDPASPRSQRILATIARHPEKTQHNAGPASNYEDELKLRAVQAEKNLRLFLGTRVVRAEAVGGRLAAVVGRSITTGRELRLRGRLFADCTGDANLGFVAGADFRVGREAQDDTGESLAPPKGDRQVMGVSVQWYAEDAGAPAPFPECPWAVRFSEKTCHPTRRGDWDWETGMNLDQVRDIERIRDYALRVTFGNWSFVKNQSVRREEFERSQLAWVAYIGGKRESRRLLGDIVLTQQDVQERRGFSDASVTTTWTIDLHYPHPQNSRDFPGEEFRSIAKTEKISPYPIPYRCFYSRNITNLFMAGRNISVTHVALGTVRVQRTTGMMGEVVGMAAAIACRHGVGPRQVYEQHLEELQAAMRQGVPPHRDG